MNQPWYIRFGWWLCEKTGHIGARSGWIYDGYFHRECKLCGRIDHKIDSARLQSLAEEAGLTEHLSSLFRWKPEINMTACGVLQ